MIERSGEGNHPETGQAAGRYILREYLVFHQNLSTAAPFSRPALEETVHTMKKLGMPGPHHW